MAKTRVFISFDFDNDQELKHTIVGQARLADSPFSVADQSLKEAAPDRQWKQKAREAIKRSDMVVVMVGPNTHQAPGVLAEVKMAREEGRRIVQIRAQGKTHRAVANAGTLHTWTWDNLKDVLK